MKFATGATFARRKKSLASAFAAETVSADTLRGLELA